MTRRICASLELAAIVTGSAWAHHNMAATYDFSQRFTETGTFTKLDWRNPHIYVSVEVTNDQGEVETWLFEGPSPGAFGPRGIGKTDFGNSAGKTITVEASRARDGSRGGLIRRITLADGTVVHSCPQNC